MVKNEYFIIGCGKFGAQLASTLSSNGLQVIAIDKSQEVIDRNSKNYDYGICTDTTDIDSLRDTGVTKATCIIVAISDIQDSIMTCANLIELGFSGNIIARAQNMVHKRILKTMGVQHITVPEIEVANRVALQAMYHFDESVHSLTEGFSWTRLTVSNRAATDIEIKDLGLREKIQSMILFIKHNNQIEFPVKPHTKISLGDIVTIMCPDFCLGNAIKFFTDQSFSNVAKKETKKLQKQVRIKNKISNKTKRKGK